MDTSQAFILADETNDWVQGAAEKSAAILANLRKHDRAGTEPKGDELRQLRKILKDLRSNIDDAATAAQALRDDEVGG